MIELVKKLKTNYLIGVITENKCDRIETILDYYKLKKYLDVVAVSAE